MPLRLYDWKGWFSKKVFFLKRGKDYHCSQNTMAGLVRNYASRKGFSIKVVEDEKGFQVTVSPRKERKA